MQAAAQQQQPGRIRQPSKSLALPSGRLVLPRVLLVAKETTVTVGAAPICDVHTGPATEQGMAGAPREEARSPGL